MLKLIILYYNIVNTSLLWRRIFCIIDIYSLKEYNSGKELAGINAEVSNGKIDN